MNKELTSDFYQIIRLIDVFAVGPALIYAGTSCKDMKPIIKIFLITTGIATIVFNGRNYLKIKNNGTNTGTN